MLTEELSRRLTAAAETQPYVPDVAPALRRAKYLRRRNRRATAAAGLGVAAAAVVIPLMLGSSTHRDTVGVGASRCPPTTAGTPARPTADESGFGWPLRGDGPAPLPAGTTQFTSQPIVGRTTLWTGHAHPDGSVPELLVEKTTGDEFIAAAVVVSTSGPDSSSDTLAVHRVLPGTAQVSAVLPFGTNGTVLVVTRPGLSDVMYRTPDASWIRADSISGAESGPGWVLFPRQVSAHFDQSPDSIQVLAENCAVAYEGPIGQPDMP